MGGGEQRADDTHWQLSFLKCYATRRSDGVQPVFFGVMATRMHTAARATARRSDARRLPCDLSLRLGVRRASRTSF